MSSLYSGNIFYMIIKSYVIIENQKQKKKKNAENQIKDFNKKLEPTAK